MTAIKDRSTRIERTELVAPADTTATATSGEIDSAKYRAGTVVFHLAGITGGGDWTVSLTSSDTSGGSFTAETSADVFLAGAPAAVTNAEAGVIVYDLDLAQLERRFIKVILTAGGTITASLLSATFEGELRTV